jgi:hypothetical protein
MSIVRLSAHATSRYTQISSKRKRYFAAIGENKAVACMARTLTWQPNRITVSKTIRRHRALGFARSNFRPVQHCPGCDLYQSDRQPVLREREIDAPTSRNCDVFREGGLVGSLAIESSNQTCRDKDLGKPAWRSLRRTVRKTSSYWGNASI